MLQIQRALRNVTLSSGEAVAAIVPSSPVSGACRTEPRDRRLANLRTLPAAYILAARLAETFRERHPWPADGADLAAPSASVEIAPYHSYVLVMFDDGVVRRSPSGEAVLGCGGVEYYRVTPSGGDVRPFNGCVEGGGTPNLPRLKTLPPR